MPNSTSSQIVINTNPSAEFTATVQVSCSESSTGWSGNTNSFVVSVLCDPSVANFIDNGYLEYFKDQRITLSMANGWNMYFLDVTWIDSSSLACPRLAHSSTRTISGVAGFVSTTDLTTLVPIPPSND